MIAALILAAGGSRRLGRSKQLEPWGSTTLLGHVIDLVESFPVDETWVVVGADLARVVNEIGPGEPEDDAVVWCVNYAETNHLLSDRMLRALETGCTRVFSVEMLDQAVPTLQDFDGHYPHGEFVVFMEPPSIDARIVNQVALFSIISRPAAASPIVPVT